MSIIKTIEVCELWNFEEVEDNIIKDEDHYIYHKYIVKDKEGNHWSYSAYIAKSDYDRNTYYGENGTKTWDWRGTIDVLKVKPVKKMVEVTKWEAAEE